MARELALKSPSAEATEELAARLAAALAPGAVVALDGDLGSGKTCFVRGLARGLGVADAVSSPTFTLLHAYEGGRLPLAHFDAWMAGREVAFLEGGGAEGLGGENVAAVEWAQRVEEYLPPARLAVRLAHLGPEARRIELAVLGAPGARPDLERALDLAAAAAADLGMEVGIG